MTTDELRESYLDFFVSKGCVRKPSDVLVPNDPTVLFTPAGMNQFKREFLGLGDPSFMRATTCQKCLRTGDIENVGKTAFHETFFEMLGNFSFGDYFKREAIHWAWEYLRQVLKIAAERLTVTVYLDDDEAYTIWRDEIKLPPERITRMGEDDNFWPAALPRTARTACAAPVPRSSTTATDPRKWRSGTSSSPSSTAWDPASSSPCPRRTLTPAWASSARPRASRACPRCSRQTFFDRSSPRPRTSSASRIEPGDPDGTRIRRMADHVRALTFCIHENVRPDKQKQGYVIRRLLRRAVLDAYQMGHRDPFLYQLVPVIADVMSGPYPELLDSVPRIQTVIREEEDEFLSKLESGLRILNETFRKTKAAGSDTVAGEDAFNLHATHGIPVEITESLAAEQNLRVDMAGFERSAEKHSDVSRATTDAAAVFTTGPLDTLKESYHHGTEFLGYTGTPASAQVVGILAQNQLADSASAPDPESTDPGPPIVLVLDRSPFYGESGGQVGDVGAIQGDRFVFEVLDTKKENEFTLHIGRLKEGTVTRGRRRACRSRSRPARRDPLAPTPPRTCCTMLYIFISASMPSRPAARLSQTSCVSISRTLRPSVRTRLRLVEDSVNEGVLRAEPITWSHMPIAEARALGRNGLVRREVPGDRPRCADGHLQPGAVRRHSPRQHGPDRPVQDRGRRVDLRGHPSHHGIDRQGGTRLHPPARRGPRRSRRRPARAPARPPSA